MKAVVLVVLVVGSGCLTTASGGRRAFEGLPSSAKGDFTRCEKKLVEAQCRGDTADQAQADAIFGPKVATLACVGEMQGAYSTTPSSGRKTWLVRNGCPRSMVGLDEEEDEGNFPRRKKECTQGWDCEDE